MAGGSVPEHNIVLTGFMGTGKSSVGRVLAAVLDRRFVDTDDLIVERHGPIPTIFADHGEAAFRAHERALADELADQTELVVSTGGGMLVDPAVAERFESTGRVFCLTASPTTIVARVLADGVAERPLLDTPEPETAVADLLAGRAEVYARFEAVPTDDRTIIEIVDDLLDRVRVDQRST
ncbi:MAG: shikimate kinase [Actinomycetota bacterium]